MSFLALAISFKVEWTLGALAVYSPLATFGVVCICLLSTVSVGINATSEWFKLPSRLWWAALRALPRWLIVLGVAVVLAEAAVISQLKTETDETVAEQAWFQKNGRFFLRVNGGPAEEISPAEYQELWRQVHQALAAAMIVFSYVSLFLSQAALQVQSEWTARERN